ncbi:MAG TPA: energy transducer TonB [Bryobacteraceae bacterium]
MLAILLIAGLTATASSGPIRVGGSVQQKKLVKKVTPAYPPEAKAKGLKGTVKLQAIIDKEGKVKELKTLSGPEELVQPSIEAVKQWEYTPTLLNGEPVEVITDIDVNYTLSK